MLSINNHHSYKALIARQLVSNTCGPSLLHMLRETSSPAGALPVALAFLDHGREAAQVACQVLTRLCYYDLSCQLLEMLAKLQGVHRLSNILCTMPASMARIMATGMAISIILNIPFTRTLAYVDIQALVSSKLSVACCHDPSEADC